MTFLDKDDKTMNPVLYKTVVTSGKKVRPTESGQKGMRPEREDAPVKVFASASFLPHQSTT